MRSARWWFAVVVLGTVSACAAPEGALDPASNADAAATDPVVTDPESVDPDSPPAMLELNFRSGGAKLNGLLYLANGAGPHPSVVLLHGYAGNERNLDLAQAMRRAGYNVLYFNYRGSWGSGGEFSASHVAADTGAAVNMLRDRAIEYGVDPGRIALVGHSFGGFAAARGTLNDPAVSCLGFIAGANLGTFVAMAEQNPEMRELVQQALAGSMDRDGGPINADPETVIEDIFANGEAFEFTGQAEGFLGRPVLMVGADRDQETPRELHHDPLVAALREAGHDRLTEVTFDDDHYFSSHRIALGRAVVDWLDNACFVGR